MSDMNFNRSPVLGSGLWLQEINRILLSLVSMQVL